MKLQTLYMLGMHKHDSKGKDNVMDMGQETVPVADRIYVLRFIFSSHGRRQKNSRKYEYYTGQATTRKIYEAKIFTLEQAKNAKQFAKTTHNCEVKRVTQKMLFKAALQGV